MSPVSPRKSFGTKLRELMEAKRIGGAEIARLVGTHHSIVNRWHNDGGWPKPPMLLELARVLLVPVEYLIDDTMTEPPAAPAAEPAIAPHLIRIVQGLGEEEAERRLLLAPARPAPASYGGADPIPVATDAAVRGQPRPVDARKPR